MHRAWINQPSTLQPLHHHHGRRVLVDDGPRNDGYVVIYFVSGAVVSQIAHPNTVSKGWPERGSKR